MQSNIAAPDLFESDVGNSLHEPLDFAVEANFCILPNLSVRLRIVEEELLVHKKELLSVKRKYYYLLRKFHDSEKKLGVYSELLIGRGSIDAYKGADPESAGICRVSHRRLCLVGKKLGKKREIPPNSLFSRGSRSLEHSTD